MDVIRKLHWSGTLVILLFCHCKFIAIGTACGNFPLEVFVYIINVIMQRKMNYIDMKCKARKRLPFEYLQTDFISLLRFP